MDIKASKVTKSFMRESGQTNFFYAVRETELEIKSGQFIEINGRSGSGKSTLLNMLAGILTPTEGKVFAGETDLYALSDEERSVFRNENIGVIPQGQTGLSSLTVMENVLLPCRMYGRPDDLKRAEELLRRVGIWHLRDVYPNELSGGELRRMAIARALINSPSIILADEPTGDLDDENTGLVLTLLKELAEGGASVLVVTHDHDVDNYAHMIYHMDAGTLKCNT
ncbi:MAG: ABC transporter ATP-binding protein [Firmicutes bacterium]|nr:ABC transporter ATP-binding protein [Bacillota bacterium]